MTEPTDALLPCPFCGEAAKHSFNSLYGDMSMASCKSCGATAYAPKWNRRAVLAKWGQPAQAAEPVAVVVPCYTPSGKRVALCSAKQDLPIGTKLYAAPQPSPTAQADNKKKAPTMSFHNKPDYHIPELIEALKAHRLPHDTPSQLADSFRIGWMACRELAQADSVPAVSDLPPLPAPDLRDVGTKPQEIKEFLKGYATEYARTAIAARAPADSVQEDAAQRKSHAD